MTSCWQGCRRRGPLCPCWQGWNMGSHCGPQEESFLQKCTYSTRQDEYCTTRYSTKWVKNVFNLHPNVYGSFLHNSFPEWWMNTQWYLYWVGVIQMKRKFLLGPQKTCQEGKTPPEKAWTLENSYYVTFWKFRRRGGGWTRCRQGMPVGGESPLCATLAMTSWHWAFAKSCGTWWHRVNGEARWARGQGGVMAHEGALPSLKTAPPPCRGPCVMASVTLWAWTPVLLPGDQHLKPEAAQGAPGCRAKAWPSVTLETGEPSPGPFYLPASKAASAPSGPGRVSGEAGELGPHSQGAPRPPLSLVSHVGVPPTLLCSHAAGLGS